MLAASSADGASVNVIGDWTSTSNVFAALPTPEIIGWGIVAGAGSMISDVAKTCVLSGCNESFRVVDVRCFSGSDCTSLAAYVVTSPVLTGSLQSKLVIAQSTETSSLTD